ncbi:MAG TPA: TonB-dependent receptor, partial [Bacteroidales bacterium]|nr:TonB-dependent receptor [Bacteroidales bacterium]
SESINLNGGVELSGFQGNYFKTIDDLLGGEFWVDIDQFAERDFRDSIILQNDLNNPNRVVGEGDIFGYDYNLHQRHGNIWTMASFSNPRIDWYIAGQFSATSFWREGFMRNGRFPENSYGESSRHIFYDYAFKGGATWKITGRHFLEGNLAYITRAPNMRNVFMSPRTRDHVVPEMKSEVVFSGELSYHWRSPLVRARLTAYHTDFRHQNEINSFYHDYFQTFVNHAMQGINRVHQGLELGTEVNITSTLSAQAVASLGNFRYTNRPTATISYDNGSRPDTTSLIYSRYFYVPGTPQTAISAGLRYSGPRFLFINLNLNYFDNIYLDFNPEIRTSAYVTNIPGVYPGDPIIGELTKQQRGTGGFTLDTSIGKSWRVLGDYFVNLNFSVSNMLNNTGIVTGGFEQSRFTPESRENLFHPRRFHLFGTTYFLNIAVRY